MFWKSMSLRNKLIWLSMSGIVVLGLTFIIQSVAQEKARMSRAKSELELQSELLSQKSAEIFKDYYFDVQSLSSSSIFLSESKEQISNALNQFVLNNKKYDTALFVDALGRFQAVNGISFEGKALQVKVLEGRTYSDSVWFQKAIKGEFSESSARGLTGSVVEDVHIDSISSALYGSTRHGLGFSRAVYGLNGSILGVLTLRASLRPFNAELDRHFQGLKIQNYSNSHLYIINSAGLVLSEAASQERFARITNGNTSDRVLRWNLSTQQGQLAASESVQGRSGFLFEADRIDRGARAWSFRSIKNDGFLENLNWSVVVSADTSELVAVIWAQRLWLGGAFLLIAVAIGLINYGISRALTKQIAETVFRVREEGRSLSEFCESFDDDLRRLSPDSTERSAGIRSAAAKVESLSMLKDESFRFVSQSEEHVRLLAERSSQNEHAIQRISVELSLAQKANEKTAQLESSLARMGKKVSQLNELFFKAQLIGYNASIEASKAGIHGRGFAAVAQELENLVDGTEQNLTEILSEIEESKKVAADSASVVHRSLSDSSALAEDASSKVALFKREFDSLVEGLVATRTSMEQKAPIVAGVVDSIHAVEESLAHSQVLISDFGKVIHSIGETGVRIDDLSHGLSGILKGGKLRNRNRRNVPASPTSVPSVSRTEERDPDFMKSDVVDRLAKKMRPRLVAETEPNEPDVSSESRDSQDLRAG